MIDPEFTRKLDTLRRERNEWIALFGVFVVVLTLLLCGNANGQGPDSYRTPVYPSRIVSVEDKTPAQGPAGPNDIGDLIERVEALEDKVFAENPENVALSADKKRLNAVGWTMISIAVITLVFGVIIILVLRNFYCPIILLLLCGTANGQSNWQRNLREPVKVGNTTYFPDGRTVWQPSAPLMELASDEPEGSDNHAGTGLTLSEEIEANRIAIEGLQKNLESIKQQRAEIDKLLAESKASEPIDYRFLIGIVVVMALTFCVGGMVGSAMK